MKTISIMLEDSLYEELGEMLKAMGQTKQTFYEAFTRTVLREKHSFYHFCACGRKGCQEQ